MVGTDGVAPRQHLQGLPAAGDKFAAGALEHHLAIHHHADRKAGRVIALECVVHRGFERGDVRDPAVACPIRGLGAGCRNQDQQPGEQAACKAACAANGRARGRHQKSYWTISV